MSSRFLLFLTILFIFFGCTNSKGRIVIDSRSSGDEKGNDTIRWETFPLLDKTVKIYSFLDPEYPEFRTFEQEVPVSKGKAVVPFSGGTHARKYYYLLFDDTYPVITANRFIKVDSVWNLRDMGGYKAENSKTIKWGKVYCSGRLSLKDEGKEMFNSLRIKTVVDLRSEAEKKNSSDTPLNVNARIVELPIDACNIQKVLHLLQKNQFNRENAIAYMQESFLSMILENKPQFSKMFELMLDQSNYPILLACSAGNDRCSYASMLVMSALGISKELILDGYVATNSLPNIRVQGRYAYDYSRESQEAVTVMLSSNKEIMNYAFQQIDMHFGSMSNYLDSLQLDSSKREKLQQILLEKNLLIK